MPYANSDIQSNMEEEKVSNAVLPMTNFMIATIAVLLCLSPLTTAPSESDTASVPFVTAFKHERGRKRHRLPNSGFLFSPQYDGEPVFWFSEVRMHKTWHELENSKYKWNFFLGTWQFLVHLLTRQQERRLVIDVDANMGQEAILAAKHGHQVFTFEPLPETFATLEFNLLLNCVQGSVTAINKGTGDASTDACIEESFVAGVMSPMASVSSQLHQDRCQGQLIQITTIDEQFQDISQQPLLLKIDNEGNEYKTLLGARWLLAHSPPKYILLEIIQSRTDWRHVSSLSSPFNYTLYFLGPGDVVVTARKYPKAYWTDGWHSRRLHHSYALPKRQWDMLAVHNSEWAST
uniref:Methyltransferase FkbM domain-containing protein n=1 Tax=Eutreptiella gymnastica TaxID=73025 RepID=A0A7S4GG26_9EUGL